MFFIVSNAAWYSLNRASSAVPALGRRFPVKVYADTVARVPV